MVKTLLKLVPQKAKDHLRASALGRLGTKLFLRASILRKKPVGLTVELTSRCNLACAYCPKSKNQSMEVGDMPFNEFKKVIDMLPNYVAHPNQICLVGLGEPLLYRGLFDAVAYIQEKYPTVNITITTNGLCLDERMGAKIIDSGLGQMTISVNMIKKEKYEQINRSKSYELVVKNTKNFLMILNEGQKSRKPKTFVQILDSVNSDAEIAEFKKYWQPYLAPNAYIHVQPLVNWAGEIDSTEILFSPNPKPGDQVERYPCPYLFATANSPIVTQQGFALACCMAFVLLDEDLILGNVFKAPLEELYTGERFRNLCEVHLRGEYQKIPACKRCDAWRVYPNIWFKNPFSKERQRWF